MAKKLPIEFTKYKPEIKPSRMMYVRIEAIIPVFDGDGDNMEDEIKDSIDGAADSLANYGEAHVTAQYEIEEDETTASTMLRQRRRDGDISGETC